MWSLLPHGLEDPSLEVMGADPLPRKRSPTVSHPEPDKGLPRSLFTEASTSITEPYF